MKKEQLKPRKRYLEGSTTANRRNQILRELDAYINVQQYSVLASALSISCEKMDRLMIAWMRGFAQKFEQDLKTVRQKEHYYDSRQS